MKRKLAFVLALAIPGLAMVGLLRYLKPAAAGSLNAGGALLLTEVRVSTTTGEFVEIFNPGGGPVDLSNVYLTDATDASQSVYYYNIVSGGNTVGDRDTDFHVRFPEGASIGPGEFQTVALNGSTGFSNEYGRLPTYELFEDGRDSDDVPDMREVVPGSVGARSGFNSSGEVVILYYWDGVVDLVMDLDYFLWGDKQEAVDKTGVAVDGPDSDTTATVYQADTAISEQVVVRTGAHVSLNSWQRKDLGEGEEVKTGGNGVNGNDETSEHLDKTWCEASPTPGAPGACEGAGDVELTKRAPRLVVAGESFTYTLLIHNQTGIDLYDLVITDVVPLNASFVAAADGGVLVENGVVSWTVPGGLASGEELSRSFVVVPDPGKGFYVVNEDYGVRAVNWPETVMGTKVDTFVSSLECGEPALLIHQLQGKAASSSWAGQEVLVEGVVVGSYPDMGFYLQEEDGQVDDDPQTSEGLFVRDSQLAVVPGDVVRARGVIEEYFELTSLYVEQEAIPCGSGGSVTPALVSLPVAALEELEAVEGMLVAFSQPLYVTENYNLGRYGELVLSASARLFNPTDVALPGAAANAVQDLNDRSVIVLDDGQSVENPDPILYPSPGLSAANTLRAGDYVENLMGVLSDGFGAYRMLPAGEITFTKANLRTMAPADAGGTLKVVSFNLMNYFNGDGLGGGFPTARGASTLEEFNRQRHKLIQALLAMDADIIGLMEIENDGYGPQSAIQDLVNGLNASAPAGSRYAFVDPGLPALGSDMIAVGLIYQAETVRLIGSAVTTDTYPFDAGNRQPLAQLFMEKATGESVAVVVNHLKSKSSCPSDGSLNEDQADGQSCWNELRSEAAEFLVNWITPVRMDDADILIIGDLNAYLQEDPVKVIEQAGYANLVARHGGLGAYSYVYFGQAGLLDHALATPHLALQVTGAEVWHINADEPRALDYNKEGKTSGQIASLFAPDPYRASDHDPVIVTLRLSGIPYRVHIPLVSR